MAGKQVQTPALTRSCTSLASAPAAAPNNCHSHTAWPVTGNRTRCRRWGAALPQNNAVAAARVPPGRRGAGPAATAPSHGAPAAVPQPGSTGNAPDAAGPTPNAAAEVDHEVTAPSRQGAVQPPAPEPAASRGDWDDLATPPGDGHPSPPPAQPLPAEPAVAATPAPEEDSSSAVNISPQQQPPEQPQQQPGDEAQPEAKLEAKPVSQPMAEPKAAEKPDDWQPGAADAADTGAITARPEVLTARSSAGGVAAAPQPQPQLPTPAQAAGPPHLPPPTALLPVMFPTHGQHGGVVFSPVPGVSLRPATRGAQQPPPVTLPAGEMQCPLAATHACTTCWSFNCLWSPVPAVQSRQASCLPSWRGNTASYTQLMCGSPARHLGCCYSDAIFCAACPCLGQRVQGSSFAWQACQQLLRAISASDSAILMTS